MYASPGVKTSKDFPVPDTMKAWVLGNPGELVLKPVLVARYETDRVVISEGLEKGDVIVTAGVNRLRERQKVRIAQGGQQ